MKQQVMHNLKNVCPAVRILLTKGGEAMTVVNRHISASLRFTDNAGDTIHSYHRINPGIQSEQVDNFLLAVSALSGRPGNNAFLTITTELMEEIV